MSLKQTGRDVWAVVIHIGTAQWLVSLFFASAVTSMAIAVMPGDWHPPQYWAAGATWFLATLILMMAVARGFEWIYRRKFPISVLVDGYGGADAHLVVTNTCGVRLRLIAHAQLCDSNVTFERKRPFSLNWLSPGSGTIDLDREGVTQIKVGACSGDQLTGYFLDLIGDGPATVQEWKLWEVTRDAVLLKVWLTCDPPFPRPVERWYALKATTHEALTLREVMPLHLLSGSRASAVARR